ncbi:MAG: acyl-CoA dehydrogenase family protein [Candidatus Syntropharchaeia archaeon]
MFELSEEQMDIKNAAREFAEGEFPDIAAECDEKEMFPRDVWKKACELGFIGVFIPEEYGGGGLGFLEHCIITEEFWRVDPGVGQALISTTFGSEFILLAGTEEQKEKYLPPLPKGDAIIAGAITEPDAGSDVSSISTTAVKDGDEYVINGNKMFITNGTHADYIVVLCLTNPDAERLKRHSAIIVETKEVEGLEASEIHGKMGIRANPTAELTFKDVRVPQENLIGKEGSGFRLLMEFFDRTRLHVAAEGVGVAQGALEQAIEHVRNRIQFGRPIGANQYIQFKIAEMATLVEAARNLVYKAAWMVDNGKIDPALVSMAKYYGGMVGVMVCDDALQLHGGYGYINEYPIERFYRAAKVVEIYEGTKEIEKMTIGRKLIGKL